MSDIKTWSERLDAFIDSGNPAYRPVKDWQFQEVMQEEIDALRAELAKRQPMTEEEIVAICSKNYWDSDSRSTPDVVAFARAIETHHGITGTGEPK